MIFKRLKTADPEEEAQFNDMMQDEKVTLKDRFAMLLSAFLVLVLPSIIVLGVLVFIMMWVFGLL